MSFHSTPLKISSPLSNAKRASCIASSYHLETQEKGKSIALCFERTRVGLARKSYIRSSNIFNHCTMSENGPERTRPFVLLTGTPGTGKTTTASLIAERTGMTHVNVGELIKQHKCYDGRDEDLNTNILDEDKLLDAMEIILDKAAEEDRGIVADFHVCEIFPERWFDLVLCLRTSTDVLFDRLTARGYNEKKRAENMEAEIMQVILEEARESYSHDIVHEVPSNTIEDMENNVARVEQWGKQWLEDRGEA